MSSGHDVISSWALPLVVMATRAEEHRTNQVYGNGGLTPSQGEEQGKSPSAQHSCHEVASMTG